MVRYHIKKDGTPGVCRARNKCPLGGENEHFSSQEAAQSYADKVNAENNSHSLFDRESSIYQYPLPKGVELNGIEAANRGKVIGERMKQAISSGLDSSKLYKENGLWNAERKHLHNEILNEMMDKYKNVPSEKKVILSAGQGGAGKTTCLKGYMNIDMNDYATVSSDDFKEILAERDMIPNVEGCSPMERSTLVHEESSYLADRLLTKLSSQGKNIIYDFTCKNEGSTIKRIETMQDHGYNTKQMQFMFVDITNDVAKERAKGRYLYGVNNDTLGGRYLPNEIIEKNKPSEGSKYNSINAETLIALTKKTGLDLPTPVVFDNSGDGPVKIDFDSCPACQSS